VGRTKISSQAQILAQLFRFLTLDLFRQNFETFFQKKKRVVGEKIREKATKSSQKKKFHKFSAKSFKSSEEKFVVCCCKGHSLEFLEKSFLLPNFPTISLREAQNIPG